jgi:hypothetical protein
LVWKSGWVPRYNIREPNGGIRRLGKEHRGRRMWGLERKEMIVKEMERNDLRKRGVQK